MFLKNYFKLILVVTMLFSFSGIQAQFNIGQFGNIQKLKRVPLLVVMESPNDRIVKKLEKKNPEELKSYLASIDGKNAAVKSSIASDWKLSKDVKFINKEELKDYKTTENKGKYAYFIADVYDKVKWKKSSTGYLSYTNYSLFIIGDVTPLSTKRYSFEFNPDSIITSKDITAALNDMQGQFKYKEDQVAERLMKRNLRRETGRYAKNTFSDDDDE